MSKIVPVLSHVIKFLLKQKITQKSCPLIQSALERYMKSEFRKLQKRFTSFDIKKKKLQGSYMKTFCGVNKGLN